MNCKRFTSPDMASSSVEKIHTIVEQGWVRFLARHCFTSHSVRAGHVLFLLWKSGIFGTRQIFLFCSKTKSAIIGGEATKARLLMFTKGLDSGELSLVERIISEKQFMSNNPDSFAHGIWGRSLPPMSRTNEKISVLSEKLDVLRNLSVQPLSYQDISRSTYQGMDPFQCLGNRISECANGFVEQLADRASRGEPCWFCGSKLLSAGWDKEYLGWEELYVCPSCTWNYSVRGGAIPDMDPIVETISFLHSSDLSSKEELLPTVAIELLGNWNRVHELHPSKMEEFVAGLLKGVYDCETKWVGRSGDGGVDVIALIADKSVVIQVKRRSKANHVEGVSIVREFCGAMLARGDHSGMIVTTANHFSRAAVEFVDAVTATPVISSIELIDSRMLSSMFDLVREDYSRWRKSFLVKTSNWLGRE